jgi:HSP20 family protein
MCAKHAEMQSGVCANFRSRSNIGSNAPIGRGATNSRGGVPTPLTQRHALIVPSAPPAGYVLAVPQRDLFADFARMRREMDQMMGDAWGRSRYVTRRTSGFSPNVDVYYCGDPQRAVVKVDLAGVELSEVGIEVSGRHLAIVGERPVQETEGRVYQQVEIPSGPFRRVVELQVEVDADRAKATYEDGVLRIELPLRDPGETTRRVPIGRK